MIACLANRKQNRRSRNLPPFVLATAAPVPRAHTRTSRRSLMAKPTDRSDRPASNSPRQGAPGGQQQGNQQRGPRNGDNRNGDNRNSGRPPQREERQPPPPDLEFLLIRPGACLVAPVTRGYFPLRWQPHRDVALFRPGLYLRHAGSLHLIGRDLVFNEASLYALWDDPAAFFRAGPDNFVQPGLHAAFLVKSPLAEGPPWLPMTAGIAATAAELDQGLLAPFLDPVTSIHFKATLQPGNDRMMVASSKAAEEEHGSSAITETLLYLAKVADDQSAPNQLARRALVENGHGLHRAGIGLMHATHAERSHLAGTVLNLVPEVAPLLQALFALLHTPPADRAATSAATRTLLDALHPLLRAESPLKSGPHLGTLVTWLVGLFGPRPDRMGQWPALTLFAAARYLRDISRRQELYGHPDAPLPELPFTRAGFKRALRELGFFPQEESDLERVFRALAAAEVASDLPRPKLDHLRAFKVMIPRLKGFPVAARTWLARYEHLLTAWSYRGAELRDRRADARHLAANLITDMPTIGICRAYGRVAGGAHPAAASLCEALLHADHPMMRQLGELFTATGDAAASDAAVSQRLEAAVAAKAISRESLAFSSAVVDHAVARAGAGNPIIGLPLRAPELAGSSPLLRHFLYWRAFCRSIDPSDSARYLDFLERLAPSAGDLSVKQLIEVGSLARQVSRKAQTEVKGSPVWGTATATALDGLLAEAAGTPGAERYHDLVINLAELDGDALAARLPQLIARTPVDELPRLLESIRRSPARGQMVRSEAFAELGHTLAPATSLAAARARVEWVRCAIERAKNAVSVRWLLEPAGDQNWSCGAAFAGFFDSSRGECVAAPEAAVIMLLELAAKSLSEPQRDLVMNQIAAHTQWPASERLNLLLEGNQPAAAVGFMQRHALGESDTTLALWTSALATAQGGAALRTSAIALRDLEGRMGDRFDAPRAALEQAFSRYRPARYLPEGFAQALDGWRLAQLGTSGKTVESFASQALRWSLDNGSRHFVGFLAWLTDERTAATIAPLLEQQLTAGNAESELLAALDALPFALASESFPYADFEGPQGKRAGTRLVASAITGAGSFATLERAVVKAVTAVLQHAAEPAAEVAPLIARLEALERALANAPVAHQTAEEVEEERAASAEATAAEPAEASTDEPSFASEAPAEESSDEASAETAEAGADEAESAPDAPIEESTDAAAPAAAQRAPRGRRNEAVSVDEKLARSTRKSARKELAKGVALALSLLREVDPTIVWATLPMLRRVRDFAPGSFDLRREIIPVIESTAATAGMRLADPHHLLTTDYLEQEWVELDRTDLAVWISLLVAVQQKHELQPKMELRRNAICMPLLRASKPKPAPTLVTGEEPVAEAVEAQAGELPEGDESANTETEESAAPEAESKEERPSGPLSGRPLVKLLTRALGEKGTSADRLAAFGDEVMPLACLAMIERSRTLRFRAEVVDGTPMALLSWKSGY